MLTHRSEWLTDDAATSKNERKFENGGSRTPPNKTDELKSDKPHQQQQQQQQTAVNDEETIRTRRIKKCVGCCKSFIAFLFSTIGLTILLVGYTILGGFIFKSIEHPHEVCHVMFRSPSVGTTDRLSFLRPPDSDDRTHADCSLV